MRFAHRLAHWLIALALVLPAGAARSAEPLAWVDDGAQAARQAEETGRLLFVLHLSGDFSSGTMRQRPFLVYQGIALADDEVRQTLATRYVLTWRHVGQPAVFAPEDSTRGKSKLRQQDEFAVAYVCLHDGRVIHFLPGFVTSKELLAGLKFAADCCEEFMRFPADEQVAAAQQMHRDAASERSRAEFSKLVATTARDDATPRSETTGTLTSLLVTAAKLRGQRLTARLGRNWTAEEFPKVAAALGAHGGTSGDDVHLVLGEHPLPPLDELAAPAYAAWSGQRFWQPSGRRAEIEEWIVSHSGKGRPLLLAVEGEPGSGVKDDPLTWPIKDSVPLPNRDDFDVLTLSLDDLAVWLTDKELGPIKHPAGRQVRYVVFDRRGEMAGAIYERDRLSKLVSAMNAASRTGETAATIERVGK